MEAILSRRSIREYTSETIPDDTMNQLLKAAMSAPSAGNEQPWHFIVIEKQDTLNQIADLHPDAEMLRDAPAAILVCGDIELEEYDGYWVQDCSAATQNILITAETKDLGSVWVGIHPDKDRENGIRDLFDLPENIIPFSIVSLGRPAEKKPPVDRYDESRVHYNCW
ncbi:nitroreductase family protein [Acetohalobium arabaticum]|uniref:Nitroreductase n=1 Tax=Acetohalobium arabaticum (strain ATCC 49924 / DSM 5501 / Z-7288) TaxID=574087 RepID=D9QT09_ACEAZ|nr:nitroreductase family protein [Acetohalobium arabaticum]ADL13509.1 nitroreductase [Acetohalobium arabaticum DSM 5501]